MKKAVHTSAAAKRGAGLLADIGNTSLRVALYADGEISGRFDGAAPANRRFDEPLTAWLARCGETVAVNAIAVASVSDLETTELFAKLLRQHFPDAPLRVISGDMPGLPLKFARGFVQKDKVGADRLANAMAAVALKKHPCVIADFGTALTVDGVNERGEFMGGMILPGMATLLRAMRQNTARLPALEVPPKPFAKLYGQNTQDAMLAGAEHGYRGLAREAAQTLQRVLCGKCNLLATGGMAGRVAPGTGLAFEIHPNLTLLGIAQILNTGENK